MVVRGTSCRESTQVQGEAESPAPIVSLPARGRPPEAAARRRPSGRRRRRVALLGPGLLRDQGHAARDGTQHDGTKPPQMYR